MHTDNVAKVAKIEGLLQIALDDIRSYEASVSPARTELWAHTLFSDDIRGS